MTSRPSCMRMRVGDPAPCRQGSLTLRATPRYARAMTVAEFEAAGLYDPAAPGAADRLALLEWLVAQGATPEQMVEAQRHRSPPGLAGDLILRPRERLALAQGGPAGRPEPARLPRP